MIKNTIYLNSDIVDSMNDLSKYIIKKTSVGNVLLKNINDFYKMAIPNDDPHYKNVKNLYYQTIIKGWHCHFTIGIEDSDILFTLLTEKQKQKITNSNVNIVFKELSSIPDFYKYLSINNILKKEVHVYLKISKNNIVHNYRFDSIHAVYYQEKIISSDSDAYIFLVYMLDLLTN